MEIIKEKNALKALLVEKEKEYNKFVSDTNLKISLLSDEENLMSHSIDLEKFNNGKEILYVEFPCKKDYYTGVRTYSIVYSDLINAAKNDLVNGVKKMKTEYFGQKRYESYDQRCDCTYGMGPRHGTVYQRIGLKSPSKELSDYDLECCLYYLNNLQINVDNLNENHSK